MQATNGQLIRACADACNSRTFTRGQNYQRSGNVIEFTWYEGDGVLVGEVEGSYQNSYTVEVEVFDFDDDIEVSGDCSCPVGYNCKHFVAVLLAWVESRSTATVKLDSLQTWSQTLAGFHPAIKPRAADHSDYCLLYELTPLQYRDNQRLSFTAYKARRLKKGGFGQKYRLSSYDYNGYALERYKDDLDRSILRLAESLGSPVNHIDRDKISGDEGGLVLQRMLDTERCYLKNNDQAPLLQGPIMQPEFVWHKDENQHLSLVCKLPGIADDWLCAPTNPPFYIDQQANVCGRIDTELPGEFLNRLRHLPPLSETEAREISRQMLGDAFFQSLPAPVKLNYDRIEDVAPLPRLLLTAVTLQAGKRPVAQLEAEYAGHCLPHVQADSAPMKFLEGQQREVLVVRQPDRELEFVETLKAMSMQEQIIDQHLMFMPTSRVNEPLAWQKFLQDDVPRLEAEGWQVLQDESFTLKFVEVTQWDMAVQTHGDNDWFDVSLEVEIDGNRQPLLPMLVGWLETYGSQAQLMLQQDEDVWVCCDDDTFVKMPTKLLRPVVETLVELLDAKSGDTDISLNKFHAPLLLELEQKLSDNGARLGKWQLPKTLRTLAQQLSNFDGIKAVKPPVGLQASLRDYQQDGLNWLQFLRSCGFGGVLADDMGLGKTVQVLANLQVEKHARRLKKPCLVVAPTSVVSNWHREAERFTPGLKVLVLHGMNRHDRFQEINHHDLIITSYALVSRDAEILLSHEYYYVVLDEAQWIKNPATRAAQTVFNLKAQHRLCVTGTPLENHLGEVWSLFNFAMPGFLDNQTVFNRRFRHPIERQGEQSRSQALAARLAPFILRRRKQQVASELPDKVQMQNLVAFGSRQALLYESIRVSMEKRVRDALQNSGLAKSHITILDALLKLRQVCCDPRLVKLDRAAKVNQSAKLELLMDTLPEMVDEGRKVLVFSQFTSMLALIEAQLEERNISYSKLTGQTRKRDEAVQRFQQGDAKVFLISLKAGGVGLNLTAADTVILYDPWWNPAVEQQAIDRAHRIGQDKTVFVYRLIVEGTVEEKIIQLQKGKQALADNLVSSDGAAIKSMGSEELLSLFEG